MSSPTPYKEVSESAYSMPGYNQLNEGDDCEIVEINGNPDILKRKDGITFSQGPFIQVTFKSYGETVSSSHGSTPRAIVTRDGKEITQEDINNLASFYFVVKGGKTATFNGGRKSHRRHKSNKNKRTRRKSVKRLHRRK
jgi:hypothetical protein